MARSELDKLLSVIHRTAKGSSRTDLSRLMPDVLKLTKAPKAVSSGGITPLRVSQGKTLKPELTAPKSLLKAAPVLPTASAVVTASGGDLGRLAAQVDQLRRLMTPVYAPVAVKTKTTSRGATQTTGNASNGVVKLITTLLGGSGVASIVSGIAGLFGGGKPEAPAPLYQFNLPQPVSVEAGVTRRGEFVPVRDCLEIT